MKPILLRVEGFGAFVAPAEIDFRRLDANTLLLVHGPTGAGKTTLFDAICFALFGVASGTRTPEQLRSDYCPPGTATRVLFEFSLPSGRYRVTREFKPTRKQDTVNEKGALEFLDPSGKHLRPAITQKKQILEEVELLLGLTKEQFRQIVMLPQNDFQQLLLADTKSKQPILEKLFRASVYSRMTDILLHFTKQQRERLEELKSRRAGFLDSLGVEDVDGLAAKREVRGNAHAATAEKLPGLRSRWEESRAMREEGDRLARSHEELKRAAGDLEKHLSLRPGIDQCRQQLAAALRAEPFRQRLEDVEERERSIRNRENVILELRKNCAATRVQLELAVQEKNRSASREEESALLQTELHRLDTARPTLEQIEKDRIASASAEKAIRKLEGEMAKASAEQATAQKELASCNGELPELEQTALRASGLAEQVRHLTSLRTPLNELHQLRKELPRKEADVRGAHEAVRRATEECARVAAQLQEIEQLWIGSQASRLADTLADGQPCPVCGATDHPRPASAGGPQVTDAALNVARLARETAERARQDAIARELGAENALRQTSGLVNNHENVLGEAAAMDPAAYAAALAQQEKEFAKAETASRRLSMLRLNKSSLEERLATMQRADQELRERFNEARNNRAVIVDRANVAQRSLPADIADVRALENKSGTLRLRVAALKEMSETAQRKHAELAEDMIRLETVLDAENRNIGSDTTLLTKKRADLRADLGKRQFASVQQVTDALLDDPHRAALQERIREWDERAAALQNTLEERTRVMGGRALPDVAALIRSEEDAREQYERAQREIAILRKEVDDLADAMTQLNKGSAQIAAAGEETGAAEELSATVSGRNNAGITLASYVLSVFLDEIIAFANQRLRVISRDRYALVRRTEANDKRRRTGLDLDVFDNHTGERRQVETLSGGEQFYAALSLALGVADAAQQHTGGVRMDAMFIDEGFGSLDSETLDVAIRALTDLQADGRLVVIISHVEELKTRITSRLEVVKGRNGSTLRWQNA
jgi:exonuclease SbcC